MPISIKSLQIVLNVALEALGGVPVIERGILYIVDPTTNGMRQHIFTLLKHLNRARYKPYLVVSDDEYLVEHAKKLQVDYIVSPMISKANKLNVGSIIKQIEEFIEERPVSLIHSHGYQACYVGAQLAKSLSVRHVSTVHTVDDLNHKKGFMGTSNDKIAVLPDRLIAVSETVKKEIERLNKVSLIYNGIEADRFAETLDVEHLYRELDLTKEVNLVGVITRLTPDKGTEKFIDAASIVLKHKPTVHFIVAGDGEQLDNLKKKASNLGIANNVHFLGFRRDVAHILKSLDVVVIPNLSPSLPIILLEALASIKPVVISDLPGVREVVGEDSVEFVKPGDVEAIAEAVKEMLYDRRKIDDKTQTGQKLVKERFNIQNMMKPTESLYLELAG